jgi:adenosine kinase
MQEKSEAIGIQCSFQNTSTKPTGRCACLIRGQDRSLVAFLGAANDFSSEHLDDSLQTEIANARFLYITGFFYSVSRESVKRIFSFKCDNSIIFNLSATFVCDGMSREDFAEIMENSYMLIGNSDELMHLNANQGFVDDVNASIEEISLQLSLAFPRTLVLITQGSEPVLLVQAGQVVLRHFVPQLPAKMVVDTNGAGDAFAAGLLVGLERNFQIAESLKLATFMAAKVIQFSGVQPPSKAEIDEFIIKEMKT